MPSYCDMVREFHETFDVDIASEPKEIDWLGDRDMLMLRTKLHTEEFTELAQAMSQNNLVETADAICDLIVVLCGTALSLGIPLNECFAEVHRSNMSKALPDGTVLRRGDGKILKGPNWSPPDLRSIIYG